jgi:predicted DNA-binding transcriptional regulator AlpA
MNENQPVSDLITAKQALDALNITRQTLDRWRKRGLPYYKSPGKPGNKDFGRIWFKLSEIEDWLKQNAQGNQENVNQGSENAE